MYDIMAQKEIKTWNKTIVIMVLTFFGLLAVTYGLNKLCVLVYKLSKVRELGAPYCFVYLTPGVSYTYQGLSVLASLLYTSDRESLNFVDSI